MTDRRGYQPLKPLPDFDWRKVKWGGPTEPAREDCSYCGAALPKDDDPDYEVPLWLWKPDGSAAVFCGACMVTWWGFSPQRIGFGDPDEP